MAVAGAIQPRCTWHAARERILPLSCTSVPWQLNDRKLTEGWDQTLKTLTARDSGLYHDGYLPPEMEAVQAETLDYPIMTTTAF